LLGSDVKLNGKLLRALPKRYTHSERIKNFPITKNQAIIEQGKCEREILLKN
jgi:hypothetical protein